MTTEHDLGGSAVAVIGMAGRFPGADDIQSFWENLCAGVESIHFPEREELEALGVSPTALNDPNYVRATAVMDGVDLFDAAFFGYTPREAELMDPQHRLFLECAYAALEHAGYDAERYEGAIGVFGGGTTNTYLLYNLLSNRETLSAFDPMQIDVSNGSDFVATRVSYKLNLKGPSFTVQTACSTSLVAIHLACQSLLNEECDMALAGGVSVHVKHREGYWYQDGGNVSPDGHCRAFDARGAGTIFGSGVAVVMLKRLEDAIADGDHIHAVVRGTALNNDGALKVGFTAPSVEGQAEVISEALALADVPADTIRYVEAHGTATKLGDPVEIRALTKAFRADTNATQFCAVGSVKTNVGHLASAAGVTSFIKTALILEHGRIPPSLHFEQPNPEIDFSQTPFYVNTKLIDWPAGAEPRRAGVSSFGVGGTNAHAVLEQAPKPWPSSPSRPWQLLLLSAASDEALDATSANLARHLRVHPDLNLADAAFTLQIGRQVFGQRRIVVCQSPDDAAAALESRDPQRVFSGSTQMQDRPVVFLFPGMGDQYVDMALELYQAEPTFRAALDRCAEIVKPIIGQDLRAALYPEGTAPRAPKTDQANGQIDLRAMLRRGATQPEPAARPIDRPALAHPILFAVEYALAQLWMEWGVRPSAMIGHSVGEYVAACLAGVFSLEDALSLVARRALLIEDLPAGAMLAVLQPEAELRPRLRDGLALAAVNTPTACVVSGPPEAVAALERELLGAGVACQRVQTDRAFHSPHMAPIEAPLQALLAQIRLRPPSIPFFSNVTGAPISAAEATDPAYWARHMRETVRFADGLQALLDQPGQVLLELGSGQTLTALTRLHPAYTAQHVSLASLRQPHQQQPDLAVLLNTLGRLWVAGVTIDWKGFYRRERRRRLALPGYAFQRRRYWIDERAGPAAPAQQPAPARSAEIADWFYSPTWYRSPAPPPAREFAPTATPWLLFVDEAGQGQVLAERLRQRGQPAIQVRRGAQFARNADGLYTLDLSQREGYGALFQDLAARGQLPDVIVHCASLGETPPADGATTLDDVRASGLYSLALLAQALEEHAPGRSLQLWVVSSGACQVESGDAIDPLRAMILSPCVVIPQEYPQIACRYIDVQPTGAADRLAQQAERLLAEIAAGAGDGVVAYRGGRRWVQRFEPLPLPADRPPAYRLRPRGAYLIVEGLVGLGWALAQLLAKEAGARLLLLEQGAFPPPDQWEGWLAAHEASDPISRKILRLRQLEDQGAEVLALGVDGADPEQVAAALARGAAHFGGLHGAIHTLGSVGGETFLPIQELGEAAIEQLLLPPLRRLQALAQALAPYELDFCLLTSSLSAALGGLGQIAHAAASIAIDAVAEQQSQHGTTPWLSVDWDVWQPEGEDLAAMPGAPLAAFAIEPAQGVEAARRLLAQLPEARVIVSTGDLQTRIKQGPGTHAAPEAATAGLGARHPRPQLASAYVPPRNDLERTIVLAWQDVFGLEEVGIDDNFFELGGNSLIAIHTMTRLKKTLKVDVPTAMLYQRPTARFLAELLAQDEDAAAQQMAERLAKRKADLGRRHQVLQRKR